MKLINSIKCSGSFTCDSNLNLGTTYLHGNKKKNLNSILIGQRCFERRDALTLILTLFTHYLFVIKASFTYTCAYLSKPKLLEADYISYSFYIFTSSCIRHSPFHAVQQEMI